ncbi:hypothetical protein EYF80_008834 [Liparis tanakae]|uniref:Uncharacterized protein n=1 Tax=Liparis tanakae TaxID=230148 RepID=A0A4Z2IS49_9TELE|nr:hypothetical protein EYF80_008834 [Liparis tanakae]
MGLQLLGHSVALCVHHQHLTSQLTVTRTFNTAPASTAHPDLRGSRGHRGKISKVGGVPLEMNVPHRKLSVSVLTSCDAPTWMHSCSMDQLAASNTTTLPPLRATHSFGFITLFESLQVGHLASGPHLFHHKVPEFGLSLQIGLKHLDPTRGLDTKRRNTKK